MTSKFPKQNLCTLDLFSTSTHIPPRVICNQSPNRHVYFTFPWSQRTSLILLMETSDESGGDLKIAHQTLKKPCWNPFSNVRL
ncbi:hypothetical protein L1887_01555 [Cichorium endivia]|nr:hypothetical protein L1887_01555 [Cichorium endivia]